MLNNNYRIWLGRLFFISLYPSTLGACRNPCAGLECGEDSIATTIQVYLQATDNTLVRSDPSLQIVGSFDQGSRWSISVNQDSDRLFTIGTPANSSLYTHSWFIGQSTLTETRHVSSQIHWASHALEISEYTVVGSPSNSSSQRLNGQIEIYRSNDFDTAKLILEGNEDFQQVPTSLHKCGDLDQDGEADWLATDLGTEHRGRIWLGLSGQWISLSGTHSLSQMSSVEGTLTGEGFGHAILCDRDWTGDGQIDLIVSSPFANVNGVNGAGRIQLFQNNSGEFQAVSSVSGSLSEEWLGYRLTAGDIDGDQQIELASTRFEEDKTSIKIYSFSNPFWQDRYSLRVKDVGTFFGYHIKLADVNNDGLEDLLVGAPYQKVNNMREAGYIYIYPGTNNFLDWVNTPNTIQGTKPYERLGNWFTVADMNQDGIQDIISTVFSVEN